MEGKAKSTRVFGSFASKNIELFSEHTLERIKKLTFKKLVIHLKNFFYKRATLLVVYKEFDKRPSIQMPRLEANCKFLNTSYTEQINSLSNLARDRIAEFFAAGAKCLGFFYEGKLVGYTWCHYHDYEFPFFAFSLEIDKGVYIGPSFVANEFRGKRIHGFLLTKMFSFLYDEGYKYVWSSVLSDNYSSLKGLISVGFRARKKIKVVRVFKAIVYKNIAIFTQKQGNY